MNDRELDEIFNYFDRDCNGYVDVTEFLVGIRGDLNDRRKTVIRMAFNVLDTDRSGYITVEEIADVYDVSHHPDVTMGKKTEKQALREFMGQWERGEKDGIITYEEFEEYYKDISASIDDEDYFELMIRNAWRIAGGEGQSANTANLRVLVTDKDGKQRVATVEKELGLKQGDREEIRKRLAAQGVDASNVELYGGMDTTEKPRAQRGGVAATRPSAPAARNSYSNDLPRAPAPTSVRSGGRAGAAARPSSKDNLLATTNSPRYDRNEARAKIGLPPAPPSKDEAQVVPFASAPVDIGDIFDDIHSLLYNPPCSIDELGSKLMISPVTFIPRVTKGAFITRLLNITTNPKQIQNKNRK